MLNYVAIVPVPCLDDDFCRRALPNAKDVKCNKHFCMCLNSDGSLYESCSMKDMVAMPKSKIYTASLIEYKHIFHNN